MTRSSRLAMFILLGLTSISASAVPVHWTLGRTFLQRGGTLVGTFTYDADLGEYSDVQLFTFGGDYEGGLYSIAVPEQQRDPGASLTAWMNTDGGLLGQKAIHVPFIGRLTNEGGNRTTGFIVEGTCVEMSVFTGGFCLISQTRTGYINSNLNSPNVVGLRLAVVPLPGAVLGFLSALAALAGLRRSGLGLPASSGTAGLG